MKSRLLVLATFLCTFGMLIVILAGALVTNTGSGDGCGTEWPLCHGKFVPAYFIESIIEYSHRLITGLEGLLVLGLFIYMLVQFVRGRRRGLAYGEPFLYSGAALFFTLLQAFLGALAVIYPTSPEVMALHFGFSILGFTATWLLFIWTVRNRRGKQDQLGTVPSSVLPLSLGVLVFSYVVIYLGAYIRHKGVASTCTGWPLCEGAWLPDLSSDSQYVFWHRLGAAILGLVIIFIYFMARSKSYPNRTVIRLTTAALILILIQITSGWFLTYAMEHADATLLLIARMIHGLIISLFYAVCIDLTIRTWLLRNR